MDLRLATVALALVMSACQSAPTPATSAPAPPETGGASIALYQYAGTRQCERGGKSAQDLQRELSAAGVQAPPVTCAQDGRMYAQACGSADGRLLVAQVPQAQAAAAARLGLKPLRELPDAVAVPCR